MTMTNNPTIDGVSRELLTNLLHCGNSHSFIPQSITDQLRALITAQTDDLREHCKQCAEVVKTWPEWKQNCLGGAPAVERQEPAICAQIQSLLDIDARGALAPHGIGGLARELLTKSKSTIAQLQARIAELESVRGEPVAYADPVAFENFKNHAHKGGHWDHEWMWAKPDSRMVALYTAPPAPVEVVLPERKPKYDALEHPSYMRGWNACLDATAALNEGRK